MEPLECSTIVYRTIFKKKFIDDSNRPLAIAFHRRPPMLDGTPRDEKGLSVNYNVDVPGGCAQGMTGKRVIVSLHVGWIRDIGHGLDVVPDKPNHANIVGIPREEEDLERLEQIATALRSISRHVWP